MSNPSLSVATTHSSPTSTPITVAYGDGIGPEIMSATLRILHAAGAQIAPEVIDIGEKVYLSGQLSGIAPEAWDSLRRTKVFLKAPITTPSGGGYKSLNVTIRKTLGLYANVRPCISYAPYVETLHLNMDVVIIRENEEDLYAGIEHRQTDEVFQCLKLITRPGCEKIIRYAFEYAQQQGRKKVTCMVKDNIMKMTDGLFYQVFEEIGAHYPHIARERYIIDIGAARLATKPQLFDVIVTPNLYGDIISDIAAEMTGSVGLAGSANIGEHVAMFEAIHGSAPDIAGQNCANPSGLLLAAVMMLVHIGQPAVAQTIHNAWLTVLEQGLNTADIAGKNTTQTLGTTAFADAVIAHLGQMPQHFTPISYTQTAQTTQINANTVPASTTQSSAQTATEATPSIYQRKAPAHKTLVGVDVFIHQHTASPDELAAQLQQVSPASFPLQMITNRGVKVWPNGFPETFCTDHWRCRFLVPDLTHTISPQQMIALLGDIVNLELDVIKTENLCMFDGEIGFALGQGQ
jgi:isocitrate dehydrogenase